MNLTSAMARFRIATRIQAGFGFILLLLAALAVKAFLALSGNRSEFDEYARVSDRVIAVEAVQADINLLRRNVLAYTADGSADAAKSVVALAEEILRELTALRDGSRDEARRRRFHELVSHLESYRQSLEKVVATRGERESIIAEHLNRVGPRAEHLLYEIIDIGEGEGDMEHTRHAVDAYRALAEARLSVWQYLGNTDRAEEDALFERATASARQFASGVEELGREVALAEQQQRAVELASLAPEYIGALDRVRVASTTYKTLITETMVDQATAIATGNSELVDEMQRRLDTVEAETYGAIDASITLTIALSLAAVVIGIGVASLIARGISRPVAGMTQTMTRLAAGDHAVDVPALDNRDEIGEMARAVDVFKRNAVEQARLQEAEKAQVEARERRAVALDALIKGFEGTIGDVVASVSSSAGQMQGDSTALTAIADETSRQSLTVASAADQASSNVQTVASAAEELNSSIGEISRRVSEAAQAANAAALEAQKSNTTVAGLSDSAQKIGQVVELISGIAEQTNLLALNATIEAARAGEAGRGFAVVAGEVKNLAIQTTRATEEVSQQIAAMQSVTQSAVADIQGIAGTIEMLKQIALGVSAAVEEQTAATGEIARNVHEAASGTRTVSETIGEVTRAAAETGQSAGRVLDASTRLGQESDRLRREVDQFVSRVRAA